MPDDRTIKLAEFVFAWIELREHVLGTVPRSNINVHATLAKAEHRINALIAAQEGTDPVTKSMQAIARR